MKYWTVTQNQMLTGNLWRKPETVVALSAVSPEEIQLQLQMELIGQFGSFAGILPVIPKINICELGTTGAETNFAIQTMQLKSPS